MISNGLYSATRSPQFTAARRATPRVCASLITVFTFLATNKSTAQDLGADLVSSYVWRGTQFGSGAHIQPWVSLSTGNLEFGAWGSFPTTAAGGGNELDLYASYSFGSFGYKSTLSP